MNSKLPIILFVVAVFLIVVIIIVAAHKKENNAHADNQKSGVAVIVGYDSESTSRDVRFSVRVIDSGDENTYNLKGVYNVKKPEGSLDEGYPHFSIGDEVKVTYSKKKTFGIEMLDVRIDRSQYDYPNK